MWHYGMMRHVGQLPGALSDSEACLRMSGLIDESQGHFEGYWGDVEDIFEYILVTILSSAYSATPSDPEVDDRGLNDTEGVFGGYCRGGGSQRTAYFASVRTRYECFDRSGLVFGSLFGPVLQTVWYFGKKQKINRNRQLF